MCDWARNYMYYIDKHIFNFQLAPWVFHKDTDSLQIVTVGSNVYKRVHYEVTGDSYISDGFVLCFSFYL